MPEPTDEQSHILNKATGTAENLMINALAGTGKSTTIRMVERKVKTAPILYLAFNRKNVDEIEFKPRAEPEEMAKRCLSTTTVRTFNGIGHRVWAQATNKKLTLDDKKVSKILRAIIDETPRRDQGPLWDSYWPVVHGVGMAKALGYIPEGKFPHARRLCSQSDLHASLDEAPDDLISDLIDAVLVRSIQAAYEGNIDYNDQVYMPALFGGTFPKFPLVAVDEYQDLNPTNHALLDRLVKGRLIGVGDPWQNIYGFRGAKAEGMAEAKDKFRMTNCDLSISFRCPKAIVEAARWRVPHFKWIKDGGHVEHLAQMAGSDFDDDATVICRNNAPLFSLALRLLASGRSVSVAGSDIGPRLVGLMKRLGPDDMSQASVLSAINDWEAEKIAKESKTAADMAACMRIFANYGSTLSLAIAMAEHIMSQHGTIRMMTGHKSKGLEFPVVYHLDPWLLKEDNQDLNLRYVIQTRAMDRYYEINSLDIRWE